MSILGLVTSQTVKGDNMSWITLKIYNYLNKSPDSVKKIVGFCVDKLPLRITHGKTFVEYRDFIRESEYWDREKLQNYQCEKLKELLRYAYNNVIFYKELMDNHSINPERMDPIECLERMPFITKDIIRENFDNLISKSMDKKDMKYITTGGSTAKPFGFYINYDASIKEWAFMTNQWGRVGYRHNDPRAVLRGYITDENKNEGLYSYNPLRNELFISSFHMNDKNMEFYIELIESFKPNFINCFPSSIYVFAKYLKRKNKRIKHRIKAILASSEIVIDQQRKLVEEVFNCRYFSYYGLSEKVLAGAECEYSRHYHMFPQYGYMELIDADGNVIREEGIPGEIVGTGFLNTAMPFIRYKTGDIGVYSKEKCKCGRNYPLLKKIEGRIQEYIVGKEHNLVSSSCLNTHSELYDNVESYQYYQDRPGKVVLKIVRRENYTEEDTRRIIHEHEIMLKGQVELSIEFVDEIHLTKRGKYKIIEQKMNIYDFMKNGACNHEHEVCDEQALHNVFS